MKIIDTHAHLYLKEFNDDLDQVIERATKQGVYKVLLPHIDSQSTRPLHQLCKKHPGFFYPMMGLHPTSVKENFKTELDKVEKLLRDTQYVAIGEAGMDLYWDKSFIKEQQLVFEHQLFLAEELDLPLVIHSRQAEEELIQILKSKPAGSVRGVFHRFTGTPDQAKRIIDLGFHVGIGGIVTFKNSGVDKIVRALSPENILVETDAPFLAPVPYRGKRNESAFIIHVIEKIAEIFELPVEEIAGITTNNAINLFKIK
ncbi:MAG: TatD family hydrolase [Bacteroidota bacterium]